MMHKLGPYLAWGCGLVLLQALVLFLFGQPVIATSGQVLLWSGNPLSADNSQQLADWYTFSHIIHGILFFWVLSYFFPRLPLAAKFALAMGMEVGWEIIENTPWLIEHYRQQALAQGYSGDSILNSLSDTVAMIIGFVAAYKLPWKWVLVAAIVVEGLALYFVRDGLVLNIMNLIYPLDFINNWQAAGHS